MTILEIFYFDCQQMLFPSQLLKIVSCHFEWMQELIRCFYSLVNLFALEFMNLNLEYLFKYIVKNFYVVICLMVSMTAVKSSQYFTKLSLPNFLFYWYFEHVLNPHFYQSKLTIKIKLFMRSNFYPYYLYNSKVVLLKNFFLKMTKVFNYYCCLNFK